MKLPFVRASHHREVCERHEAEHRRIVAEKKELQQKLQGYAIASVYMANLPAGRFS